MASTVSLSSDVETVSKQNDRVILRVEGVYKAFPGVLALNDVSINVKKGEILAILGENGAGKSTLMKILSGLYKPDTGRILVDKNWFATYKMDHRLQEVQFKEPRDAIKLGIGQVYQHFQLVGPFTVGENITVGNEFTYDFKGFKAPNIFIDKEKTNHEIRALSERFGLPIDPTEMVENLPVGLKQRTEILKQLYREAELLILDEPTAVLTPTEVDELFKTMKKLKDAGKALIFISHKLRESLRIADRIVVLRKGKVVGETKPGEVTERELAEMLVGRRLLRQLDRADLPLGKSVLNVEGLILKEDEFEEKEEKDIKYLLRDINFTVYKNQIVGVVGVQGNGQTELLNCLMGMRRPTDGSITFLKPDGKLELTELNTLDILRAGVGYIPEDRTMQGLILDFNLSENSWLAFHGFDDTSLERSSDVWGEEKHDSRPGWLRRLLLPIDKMKSLASKIVDNYEVKTPSIQANMRNLSGGNQQKVLIGREFAKNPELIIAAEPTRGVDIGVMEKVHVELIRRRDEGTAIFLVSSDLDEILKLADYVLVMYEGQIVGQGDIDELSISEISELMTFGSIRSEDDK